MKLANIDIQMHGPAATHNMPCAVCRELHAVLDLNRGIFQPCWRCQCKWKLKRNWWEWLTRRTRP